MADSMKNGDLAALRAYLGGLTVTQGSLTGRPLAILPWQARFLAGAFRPGVTSAALSMARANAKTTFLSAVACATLDGPLAVDRGETVIVASSFEQATDRVRARDRLHGRQAAGPEAVEGVGHRPAGAH